MTYSDQHYKSLFDYNPFPVFSMDLNGCITDVNSKGLYVLNYDRSELLSKHFNDLFKQEEQEYIQLQFEEVKNGEGKFFSSTLIKNDGIEIHMNLALIPIMDENSVPIGAFMVARDITGIVVYEEKLRKVQMDLENTLRQQQGMIFKFVRKGNNFIHTLCDGELLYKMRLTPKDVIGKTLDDILSVEEAHLKNGHYEEAWNGRNTYYEGQINGVDYLAVLRPVIANGEVVEVIGSCIDITDRKRTEEELRKKRNLYHTVLNTMSEGIFIYEQDESLIPLNENVGRKFRIDSGTFNESTVKDWGVEFVKEDGSSFPFEELPGVITKNKGLSVSDVVLGMKMEDKIIQWISMNSRPLVLAEKEEQAALVTFTDITKQKEQELKLRESYALQKTLINHLNSGILVTDEKRRMILLNKTYCEMFGLNRNPESYIGEHSRVLHDTLAENVIGFNSGTIAEMINKHKPVADQIETTDGKYFTRSFIPFSVNDEKNGYLWVHTEVTERKKMEDAIIQAKEEAEKANMAKSDFLSKMSHELRTPLNGILGFAQLLELHSILDEQQQKYVQQILNGGRHLTQLINEILDLSRIETGRLKIIFDTVDLKEIVKESINMVRPLAEKKKIKIIQQLNECQNYSVFVDPVRLRQVLLNLLDNAIKYNRENGEVKIECEKMDNQLIIYVKDTGMGFSVEESVKVFTPFYRIAGTVEDGAGIGLSLVKQLVQLMGGTVGVTSKKGEGSDFWFSLPIFSKSVVTSQLEEHKKSFQEFQEHTSNYRILYVEDNQANLTLVNAILDSIPFYTLISAGNGKEGIKTALTEQIDLILLDINLPDMDGYEVVEVLKSNECTETIPVIALSASAMPQDIQKALHSGFKAYLTKPLNVEEFLMALDETLHP